MWGVWLLKEGGGWQYLGPGVGNSALGWRMEAVSTCHGVSSWDADAVLVPDTKDDVQESCDFRDGMTELD